MAEVRCRECDNFNDSHVAGLNGYRQPIITIQCQRIAEGHDAGSVQLEGILTCRHDGNKWPIKLYDNIIDPTLPVLPITESVNLISTVPDDLIEDVKEAERCYFSQCYKASVVMCRRAIQLALESKGALVGAKGRTLGPLLANEKTMSPRIITDTNVETMLEAVKNYGDVGAHRVSTLTHQEANIMIFAAVKAINHIFR